jgi:hypothetical protein
MAVFYFLLTIHVEYRGTNSKITWHPPWGPRKNLGGSFLIDGKGT